MLAPEAKLSPRTFTSWSALGCTAEAVLLTSPSILVRRTPTRNHSSITVPTQFLLRPSSRSRIVNSMALQLGIRHEDLAQTHSTCDERSQGRPVTLPCNLDVVKAKTLHSHTIDRGMLTCSHIMAVLLEEGTTSTMAANWVCVHSMPTCSDNPCHTEHRQPTCYHEAQQTQRRAAT